LRSGKGSCYEGGVRVPLIVRGPGVASGKSCSVPVYSCDLYPTLLRAAGLEDKIQEEIDGLDITALLENSAAPFPRDTLYFHYPHYYQTTSPVSAIRKGRWKLLSYYNDGHVELYDLSNDLGETKNLAEARPAVARQLAAELKAWRGEVNAQLPVANPVP
jgi:arylsulfatase A-like enzyme